LSDNQAEAPQKKQNEISKKLRFEVFKRDGFTCQYCGRKPPDVELELDHIVPKNQCGRDEAGNLITACKDCNRGKRDRDLDKPAPAKPKKMHSYDPTVNAVVKEKPTRQKRQRLTDDEKAKILALLCEGNSYRYVAAMVDVTYSHVGQIARANRELIMANKPKLEDRLEEYTDIITLAIERIRDNLQDDEKELSQGDLVNTFRIFFDKRQLLLREPTHIHASEQQADVTIMDNVVQDFEERFLEATDEIIEALPDEAKDVDTGGEGESGEPVDTSVDSV
jgi:hypothetical protein